VDILYSTSEQVLAALGLDSRQVSDVQLKAHDIDSECLVEISNWLPNHETVYNYQYVVEQTADRILQSNLLTLCCKWYGAYVLATAIELRIPQRLETEANNNMTLFSIPVTLKEELLDKYSKMKFRLLDLIAKEAQSPATSRLMVTAASASYDPITGVSS
jgi:hypothetical protein